MRMSPKFAINCFFYFLLFVIEGSPIDVCTPCTFPSMSVHSVIMRALVQICKNNNLGLCD